MNGVFIIANPSSGKNEAEQAGKLLIEKYKTENDGTIEFHLTKHEEDIAAFAKEASDRKFEYIVIIGGDGTNNLLLNAYKDLDHKPKVGIIPTGTINNVASSLNIDQNYERAVDQFLRGKDLISDAGQANDQIFISSVSAGTIPEIAWQVSEEDKEKLGTMAYVFEGIQNLTNQDTIEFDLEIDNNKIGKIKLDLLLVGVSNSVAGISGFFNEAEYRDGYLHMFALKKSGLGEKIGELGRIITSEVDDGNGNSSFIVSFKEAIIYLNDSKNHYPSVDGDQGPEFPLTLKILPEFVTFIVPDEDEGFDLF